MKKKGTISVRIIERKLNSGKTCFYLDYSTPSLGRNKETLNLCTSKGVRSEEYRECKAQAQAIAQAYRTRLMERQYGVLDPRLREIPVLTYLHKVFDSYQKADKRKVTAMLTKAEQFFDKNLLIQDLTPSNCEEFAGHLKSQLKKETSRGYFQFFKKMLVKAVEEKYIPTNPAQNVVIKSPPDHLTKAALDKLELRKLYETDCRHEVVKRAFLFCCNAGTGFAECSKIKWGDIKEINGRPMLVYDRSKNGNYTQVALNSIALTILGKPGEKNALIFTKFPSYTTINKCLLQWMKMAGINKHITFYCSRHSFATLQASQGTNLRVISKNMGQTSTRHTIKYINYVQTAQSAALDKIGDW
jgi:integrase